MNHTKMRVEEWIRRANFSDESRPSVSSIKRLARLRRIDATKVAGKWYVHVDPNGDLINRESGLDEKWLSIL